MDVVFKSDESVKTPWNWLKRMWAKLAWVILNMQNEFGWTWAYRDRVVALNDSAQDLPNWCLFKCFYLKIKINEACRINLDDHIGTYTVVNLYESDPDFSAKISNYNAACILVTFI